MSSVVGLRQQYLTILAAYKAQGRSPVTTASDLKFIVPVQNNRTTYTFPVIVGEDTHNYPEAVLLDRADAFTALELGIFIGHKPGGASDVKYDMYSYPNSTIFNTGGDADAFRTLFNHGLINCTINNVQYLQNYGIARMRKAPIVQTGLTYGYTTTGATAPNGVDSFDGATDGFYPIVPTLQLSGTSKLNITVTLPGSLNAAASGEHVLILCVRGFLSLGASNLNK
jgi:hypothetical protein